MQILPFGIFAQKLLGVSLEELFLFVLRVDLTRRNPGQQIVLGGGDKLLLHDVDHVHRGHDVGNVAMHLQACRLVARCLADHDRLDEVPHDRHQPALGLLVGIVAGKEEKLANGDLGIGRIELRLQPGDLLLKILRGGLFGSGQFHDQLLTVDFQLIEMVVEDRKTRPAFGMPDLDLLHQACLLRLDRRKLDGQLVLPGGDALQLAHLVCDHLLRNPVKNVE
ncbi:MAG: hypothetical protein WA980_02890 [Shinella zoogloeoides]|uniref:hypothetical protein n=1 Tax=Shinella zoogloeoides TaxID=352475 RepID=UPI003C73F607